MSEVIVPDYAVEPSKPPLGNGDISLQRPPVVVTM
jgi:hypothetical protein